jgi:hypothetical protein
MIAWSLLFGSRPVIDESFTAIKGDAMEQERKKYISPDLSVVSIGDSAVETLSGTDVLAKKLDDWLNS